MTDSPSPSLADSPPNSASTAPDTATQDGAWQSLSPLSLLYIPYEFVQSISVGGIVGFLGLGVVFAWWLVGIALVVGIVVSAIYAVLYWYYFKYRIGNDSIVIRSGIVSRQLRTLPFDRIHDVNIERGLLARMLGLAKVSFDTGATANMLEAKDSDLDMVVLAEAENIRELVRRYRETLATRTAAEQAISSQSVPDSPTIPATLAQTRAADAGLETALFAMSPRQLIKAGLFSFAYATPFVVVGAVVGLVFQLPEDWLVTYIWNEAVDYFEANSVALRMEVAQYSWLAWALGAFGAVLLYIVSGFAVGIGKMIFINWDFRLSLSPRAYRRVRGLTTRSDVALPLRRVQAAIIASGWLRQRYGWYVLWLQSLASDSNQQPNHEVVPFGRLADIDAVLAALPFRRAVPQAEWQACHFVFILGDLVFTMGMGLIGFVQIWFGSNFGSIITGDIGEGGAWTAIVLAWIGVGLVLLAVLLGAKLWKDARCHRWTLQGDILSIRRGWLFPREVILPCASVQSVDIISGPLLRLFAQAKLVFGVPGGNAFVSHSIVAIPTQQAEELRQAILERGLAS